MSKYLKQVSYPSIVMVLGEKILPFHRINLVIRRRINITKASSRRVSEVGMFDNSDLRIVDCFSRGDPCCSDVCDIGAALISLSLLNCHNI